MCPEVDSHVMHFFLRLFVLLTFLSLGFMLVDAIVMVIIHTKRESFSNLIFSTLSGGGVSDGHDLLDGCIFILIGSKGFLVLFFHTSIVDEIIKICDNS